MREILTDIIQQTVGLFEKIKITGTEERTTIQAVSEDNTLFLQADLTTPEPGMIGEFGIPNPALLKGLLTFPDYCTDTAGFSVKHSTTREGTPMIEALTFTDAQGVGATFRMMSGRMVGEMAVISAIKWEASFVPNKARIAKFTQLASLYGDVDKSFMPMIEGSDLLFTIGGKSAATHHASMVFEPGMTGTMAGNRSYGAARMLSLIKQAGSHDLTMRFTGRGIMSVVVTTPVATYEYYQRANVA